MFKDLAEGCRLPPGIRYAGRLVRARLRAGRAGAALRRRALVLKLGYISARRLRRGTRGRPSGGGRIEDQLPGEGFGVGGDIDRDVSGPARSGEDPGARQRVDLVAGPGLQA